jgi:NADH:ubiquinone oxidoreductase subunit
MMDKERRSRGSKIFEGINEKTKIGIKKWLHKYMKKKGFKHKSSVSKSVSKKKSKSDHSKSHREHKKHSRSSNGKSTMITDQKIRPAEVSN